MPCLSAPLLPVPTLPFPLTLSLPTLSTPNLGVDFCCKLQLPVLTLALPPIPLGLLGAGVIAVIESLIQIEAQVNLYLSLLTIPCPIDIAVAAAEAA